MRDVIVKLVTVLTIVLHCWLSYRSPKYWYLGGIVPFLWVILLIAMIAFSAIRSFGDFFTMAIPLLIFLLIWLKGHLAAKKRELNQMKARDL